MDSLKSGRVGTKTPLHSARVTSDATAEGTWKKGERKGRMGSLKRGRVGTKTPHHSGRVTTSDLNTASKTQIASNLSNESVKTDITDYSSHKKKTRFLLKNPKTSLFTSLLNGKFRHFNHATYEAPIKDQHHWRANYTLLTTRAWLNTTNAGIAGISFKIMTRFKRAKKWYMPIVPTWSCITFPEKRTLAPSAWWAFWSQENSPEPNLGYRIYCWLMNAQLPSLFICANTIGFRTQTILVDFQKVR